MVENRADERSRGLEQFKKPFEHIALLFRCVIVGALISIAAWMLANFLLDTFARQR